MLEIVALVIAAFLALPPAVAETRDCLVEYNGQCVQYDFSSSRGLNPLGNARELIEADAKRKE